MLWISTAGAPQAIFAQTDSGAGASNEVADQSPPPAAAPAQASGRGLSKDLDAWLKIGQDGMITLSTGKVEFGQGIQTAFGQLVAEDLDVPVQSVQVIMGRTELAPYDNATVGGASMPSTGPSCARRRRRCVSGSSSLARSSWVPRSKHSRWPMPP